MTTPESPAISVVVPSYNEERRIGGSLDQISRALLALKLPFEIVVVDDGSAPAGAAAAAAAVEALPPAVNCRLIRHETNRGKGAAVRTGCLAATGSYVAFIDADLATPPDEIGRLVAALDRGADIAIGVRRQEDGSDMRSKRSLPRRLAGSLFAGLARTLLFPGVSDSQCPLKAFRREAAQALFRLQKIETWAFDAEVLFLALRLGYKVEQIPVSWRAVTGSHLRLGPGTAVEAWNLLRIRLVHWRLPSRAAAEALAGTATSR